MNHLPIAVLAEQEANPVVGIHFLLLSSCILKLRTRAPENAPGIERDILCKRWGVGTPYVPG